MARPFRQNLSGNSVSIWRPGHHRPSRLFDRPGRIYRGSRHERSHQRTAGQPETPHAYGNSGMNQRLSHGKNCFANESDVNSRRNIRRARAIKRMNPMDYSRRDLSLLLPALLASHGEAANASLPSACYSFDALAAKTNPHTHNETRPVLNGNTASGCPIELHITTLAAGQMPHPPHHHVREEMLMLQKGTLEVTIAGKSTRIGPGSVVWAHSNEQHGWKNVGDTPAQYFVLAIGKG